MFDAKKKKKEDRKTKNDYRLIYVYMNERIIKEKKSSKTELKISWTVSKKKLGNICFHLKDSFQSIDVNSDFTG